MAKLTIEEKIVTALITSKKYLEHLEDDWNRDYLESSSAKIISDWCWKYFKKYNKAPKKEMETIFVTETRKNKKLDPDTVEGIELILNNVSSKHKKFNVDYFLDESWDYFVARQLIVHKEELDVTLAKGQLDEALIIKDKFELKDRQDIEGVYVGSEESLDSLEEAFENSQNPVIFFPGPLGELMNPQLKPSGLIGILAPEKRGKSFFLLEFMVRGYIQRKNVAFFQAGDMSESEQMLRTGVFLAKKSEDPQYCGVKYVPVRDCVLNQIGKCEYPEDREFPNRIAIFEEEYPQEITMEILREKYNEIPKHVPCRNCEAWKDHTRHLGVPWVKRIEVGVSKRTDHESSNVSPLTIEEAKQKINKFFVNKKRVKLSTHINGTLSVGKIKKILSNWKRKEGFVPDVILIDYADLLRTSGFHKEERDNIDTLWKELRALSQEPYEPLVVVPTQANRESYDRFLMTARNISEDKRKLAHPTAVYGLNQDKDGREKEMGLMRINTIVARKTKFTANQAVTLCQCLEIGRPLLGSFWGYFKNT